MPIHPKYDDSSRQAGDPDGQMIFEDLEVES